MEKVISQLIRETENKIIDILVGSYNSGKIDDTEKFNTYELENIKNLLFMRSELDSKLYDLLEGHINDYHREDEEDF